MVALDENSEEEQQTDIALHRAMWWLKKKSVTAASFLDENVFTAGLFPISMTQ